MKVPFSLVQLSELKNWLNADQPVFADTETCGLYGRIRLLQLYQEGLDSVLLVEWPEPIQLGAILMGYHTVWHNAHYDITTIQTHSVKSFSCNYDDTFLLSRLAQPQYETYSLDDVMARVLGFDSYARQGLDKKTLQKSKWDVPKLTNEQLLYAATDVYFMPQVWHAVKHAIDEPSYALDKSTLNSCLKFQWNGMPVDRERLWELYEANDAKVAELNSPVNVNSWKQVRDWLGVQESDDLALARYELQGGELGRKASIIRGTRKALKQNSFLDKFDTESGYIYGKFKPSARSGRLTSDDQNLQQIPRKAKSVFGYKPGDGRVLVYSDYAQLELRSICAITGDAAMVRAFRDGQDLHNFTAAMLFGENFTKAQRQLTKTYNFNLLYGGGVNMLIGILIKTAGVLLDEATANRDRNKWRNLWRGVYKWQEKGIRDWRAGRLGSTPLGRKYKAKMMTDQLNIENQGAGAEVAKLALHYLMPKLEQFEGVKLVNFIHDSFIIDCPDDPEVYQAVAVTVARCMQDAWFEMSKLFIINDLPMPVDVAVGYNWGDIESDDVENVWDYTLDGMALLNGVH